MLTLAQHSSGTGTTSASATTSVPTSGDLIVVCVDVVGNVANITPPSGYTPVDTANNTTVNGCKMYYRIADGTEGTSCAATCTGATSMSITFDQYHSTNGVFTGTPLDKHAPSTNTSGTSLASGSITPTKSAFVLVSCFRTSSSTLTNLVVTNSFVIQDQQRGSRDNYADRIVTGGSGSYSTTWSWTATTNTGACCIIANFNEPILAVSPTISGTSSLASTVTELYTFSPTVSGSSSLAAIFSELHQFTSTIAGTSSIASIFSELHQFTSTIAGTSSLSSPLIELHKFSATISGVSSLSSTFGELHTFSPSISGSSSLAAIFSELHQFTVNLSGGSSLSSTFADLQQFSVAVSGVSSLSASTTDLHVFTIGITGSSSLSGSFSEFTTLSVSIGGSSSLGSVFTELIRFAELVAGKSSLSAALTSHHLVVNVLSFVTGPPQSAWLSPESVQSGWFPSSSQSSWAAGLPSP